MFLSNGALFKLPFIERKRRECLVFHLCQTCSLNKSLSTINAITGMSLFVPQYLGTPNVPYTWYGVIMPTHYNVDQYKQKDDVFCDIAYDSVFLSVWKALGSDIIRGCVWLRKAARVQKTHVSCQNSGNHFYPIKSIGRVHPRPIL